MTTRTIRDTSGPTMLGLVGITLLMLVVGYMWATKPFPSLTGGGGGSSLCTDTKVAAGQTLHASEVVVSVFNAGQKSGAAGEVMKAFLERGFAPGDTGNAGTAGVQAVEVWADPSNPAAHLVAQQFGAGTPVVGGKPVLGDGVVVVVGDNSGAMQPKVDSIVAPAESWVCGPKVP
jgi:hypothetical protein